MGHRANEFVVSAGRADTHTDRWDALHIPRCLLDGPTALTTHVRDRERRHEPYDQAYAEGGLLIDTDRQLVLFYTDISVFDRSPALRAALTPLLAAHWPGWRLAYAHRGLATLLEHAGLPADGLLHPATADPYTAADLADLLGVAGWVLGIPVSVEENSDEPLSGSLAHAETVLTVRSPDGGVRDLRGAWVPDRLLATGPAILDLADTHPGHHLPNELLAGGGVLVDVPARTLTAWWAGAHDPDPTAVAAAWPGWRVTRHHDGLPGQVRRSGRDPDPVRMPHPVLVAQAGEVFGLDEQDCQRLLRQGRAWTPTGYLTPGGCDLLRQLAGLQGGL